ncbi:MFS transporter [Maritimibacter sp. DP1N21-5]|uniref:MFS transporter n=1 Tax=Maritimibacter sp. DP1N21-5 TaxID=2836867 RepID=UPI001C455E37|nr:MFS transporter [Maritimibacter sp. DP1N21-5]MBV7409825.1 MFS transporter [Maritimibacter sp. DP1N21-5]
MRKLLPPWTSVAAAFALNGVLLGTWASRVPTYVERLDLTEGALGVLLLFMGIGALVSFPVAGSVADQRGAVRVTRWLTVAYLVTTLCVGLAGTPLALGMALFVFGMSHGAMDVTMNSWATEVERHMGRSVMSSFHAMWSLGAGVGAAGGYLATSLGAPTWPHFGAVVVIAAVVLGPLLLLPWTSRVRPTGSAAPAFALPRGALILVGVMALAAGLGEGAAVDWSAVFLRDVLLVGEAQATLAYTVFSVTMVVMRLNVDWLINRFGPITMAHLSGAFAASGYLVCALAPSLWVALAGFVLMGMGYAAVIPMAFSRAANDPEVSAGQAIASVATLGYGALLLGPPVIGFVAHATSLRLSFGLVAVIALVIVAFSGALRPGPRQG